MRADRSISKIVSLVTLTVGAVALRANPASSKYIARVHEFYSEFGSSAEVLCSEPLVVHVRGFLTDDCCNELIAAAEESGLQR